MPVRTDRDKNAKELFLEQAAAYFDELTKTAQNAPYGQVLNHAETFCLKQGKELLRQSLENIMQEQINTHEKKTKQHSAQNVKRKNGIADTETNPSLPPSET